MPRRYKKRQYKTPESRTLASDRMRMRNLDPAMQKARAQAIKRRNAKPGYRALMAERMRERRADPAFSLRQSIIMQQLWDDPDYRTTTRQAIARGIWIARLPARVRRILVWMDILPRRHLRK